METIGKPQLEALQRLAAGWTLVRNDDFTRLYPPDPKGRFIWIDRGDFTQFLRRGWLRAVSHTHDETVYELSESGRHAAGQGGATVGEVALIVPKHLPPGPADMLERFGITTAEQAHALIRTGRVFNLPNVRAGQYVLRYFTRIPPIAFPRE
jgi:hypothetical protein